MPNRENLSETIAELERHEDTLRALREKLEEPDGGEAFRGPVESTARTVNKALRVELDRRVEALERRFGTLDL